LERIISREFNRMTTRYAPAAFETKKEISFSTKRSTLMCCSVFLVALLLINNREKGDVTLFLIDKKL